MLQKRYRPEETIAKLREEEVLLGQAKKVPEVGEGPGHQRGLYTAGARSTAACRSPGPSASRTWSARTPACAGPSPTSTSTRSSSRSRRELLGTSRRRSCIAAVCEGLHVSERRACRALGQHRSSQRRAARPRADEDALTQAIVAVAGTFGVSGRPCVSAACGAPGTARSGLYPDSSATAAITRSTSSAVL